MPKPNHCIWPIRTHYTFVSTNDHIDRILTVAACHSGLQLLPSYIWSLISCDAINGESGWVLVWAIPTNMISPSQLKTIWCWVVKIFLPWSHLLSWLAWLTTLIFALLSVLIVRSLGIRLNINILIWETELLIQTVKYFNSMCQAFKNLAIFRFTITQPDFTAQ